VQPGSGSRLPCYASDAIAAARFAVWRHLRSLCAVLAPGAMVHYVGAGGPIAVERSSVASRLSGSVAVQHRRLVDGLRFTFNAIGAPAPSPP
jgi:hypothetical protein